MKMQLDPVAAHGRQIGIKLQVNSDLASRGVALKQPDDVMEDHVEVERLEPSPLLLDECPHAPDHLPARASSVSISRRISRISSRSGLERSRNRVAAWAPDGHPAGTSGATVLSISGPERMVNGRAPTSGENRMDLSEEIAWFGNMPHLSVYDTIRRLE